MNNVYRGDIYYIQESNFVAGSNQPPNAGKPVLVISSEARNAQNDGVTVVYLTTNMTDTSPTRVNVMYKVPCIALCERIVTYPTKRLGEYVRTCSDEEMRRVDNALMWVLGMSDTPVAAIAEDDKSAAKVKELESKIDKMTAEAAQIKDEAEAMLAAAKSDALLYKAQFDAQIAANEHLQKLLDDAQSQIDVMTAAREQEAEEPENEQVVVDMTPTEVRMLIETQEENIRLKAELDVYKRLLDRFLPMPV